MAGNLAVSGFDNTASLELFSGNILAATYTFNTNNKFVLSARSDPTTLTISNLTENVNNIREWENLIYKYGTVGTVLSPTWKFTTDISASEITFSIKFPGDPALDTVYSKSTKQVIFGTRPEWKLKPGEFHAYIHMLDMMLREIETGG